VNRGTPSPLRTRPIVVVIPVLNRPQNAQPVIASLERSDPHGLCRPLFVCSPEDDAEIAACRRTGADLLILDTLPGPGDFARKIQAGFDATDEPFVFQAADDVEFTEGWAEAALYAIDKDGGYGVCGTDDRANPVVKRGLHSTHSLIRRAYVEECGASWDGPGTVFSTAYAHQWCDTELVELARLRGCFTFARGSVVLHHHPFYDRTVARDETYERGLRDGQADRDLFHARQREWLRDMRVA
jgi:glycosyl transferase family 2